MAEKTVRAEIRSSYEDHPVLQVIELDDGDYVVPVDVLLEHREASLAWAAANQKLMVIAELVAFGWFKERLEPVCVQWKVDIDNLYIKRGRHRPVLSVRGQHPDEFWSDFADAALTAYTDPRVAESPCAPFDVQTSNEEE